MGTNDKLFCDVAVDAGFITPEQGNEALDTLRVDAAINQAKPIGAYLFERNLLDRTQVAQVLKMMDRIAALSEAEPNLAPKTTPTPEPGAATKPSSPSIKRPVDPEREAARRASERLESLAGDWEPLDDEPFQSQPSYIQKSRVTYVVLGLLVGCLGIHNFYAGYNRRGFAQLLISLVLGWFWIGFIVTAIWALAEVITVTEDAQGRPMV